MSRYRDYFDSLTMDKQDTGLLCIKDEERTEYINAHFSRFRTELRELKAACLLQSAGYYIIAFSIDPCIMPAADLLVC
jgi:hypothetical protein